MNAAVAEFRSQGGRHGEAPERPGVEVFSGRRIGTKMELKKNLAILVAKDYELQGVMSAFGPEEWQEVTHSVRPAHQLVRKVVRRERDDGTIVSIWADLVMPARQGLIDAAIVASNRLSIAEYDLMCMTGVCAGLREAQPGNMILFTGFSEYFGVEFGERSNTPDQLDILFDNHEVLRNFQKEDYKLKVKMSISEHCLRQGIDYDPGCFRFHVGTAESVTGVVNNSKMIAKIEQNHRRNIAVDMESYAVALTALRFQMRDRFFVLKAMSDFGSDRNSEVRDFRKLAALYAAMATKELALRVLLAGPGGQ